MAANPHSLRATELYRHRLLATRSRVEREAATRWPSIETLDGTVWPAEMARLVAQAQAEAVRATGGYLSAFLTLETGRRSSVRLDSRQYAGTSRDSRPLAEALVSPLIGTFGKLKEGADPQEALWYGLNRATRMVSVDFDHAHRTALLEAIDADGRFDGWQRAVRGTCGACAAKAIGRDGGLLFQVHPGCQCVSEPVVKGAPDLFPRLTGAALFAAKSVQEQDDMLGPDAAEQVRSGTIELSDLVAVSPLETQPDFITQATTTP